MKQTKKSKTKGKKETNIRDEIRGLGVIIEHIDDKISLVAEQYGDIKKTLDLHTEILDSHTKTLELHTEILDSHSKILDSHGKTLESHTEMIGSMKMDVEIIKTDIAFIKGGLKRKVDADEFSVLEKRVALLEKRR